jgi:hypothetical protein
VPFFYLNPTNTISDFMFFCKNTLPQCKFDFNYNKNIIHYYPQYMFVCDKDYNLADIKIYKLEDYEKPVKYDINKYFDSKCIEIINKIYEKDFVLLGYNTTTLPN